MTKRKPEGMSLGGWVERLIEEARVEGQFDGLAGTGQPIADLDQPDDSYWWIRRWLKRNNLSVAPREFELRKKVESELEAIRGLTSETEVRSRILALNAEIARHNATTFCGPTTSLVVLDVERVLARWRERSRSDR